MASPDMMLEKPWQVQADKGSLVFANRWLPHHISEPNLGSSTRVMVWYRVCHVLHDVKRQEILPHLARLRQAF